MMKSTRILLALLWAIVSVLGVIAQDEDEEPTIPYYQSSAFNVPTLDTWDNQSTDDIAQFYNMSAQVMIRTAVVDTDDAVAGAIQDLEASLGQGLNAPIYSEKVNLADGTWAVLVFRADEKTTASAMARQHDGRTYVISLIEDNPDATIILATLERSDDSPEDDPSLEISTAIDLLTNEPLAEDATTEPVILPSGEWLLQRDADMSAMGMVFGNDSYIALGIGELENLPDIANAYNTTLLGFFVTPDNSGYLALGMAVILGTLAILALSIVWRARNLEKDLAVIHQLVED